MNVLQNQVELSAVLNYLQLAGYIFVAISNLVKAVRYIQKKRAARKLVYQQPTVPPGYYRERLTIILTEICLIPILAFLALIYSEQTDLLGQLIYFSSTVLLIWIILTLPLSVFITIKRW